MLAVVIGVLFCQLKFCSDLVGVEKPKQIIDVTIGDDFVANGNGTVYYDLGEGNEAWLKEFDAFGGTAAMKYKIKFCL